jgi:hypothetical protein
MIHGPGVKVWLRNTADMPLYDGRTQTGFSMISTALSGVAVGDYLDPGTSGLVWKKATDGTTAWLQVEYVNATTGLVEARFTF